MNYTEIVDAAYSYADRQDPESRNNADLFLRAVENRLNNRLKVQKMSCRTQLMTRLNAEYYGLPPDFAGLRDIEISNPGNSRGRCTLQYLNPEQMNNWSTASNQGRTDRIYYTIIADQLQIMPPQDGMTMEIVYYRNVPPLTPTDDENWVSIGQPNLYVFGMLVEISSFAKDKEAALLWEQRFMSEVNALTEEDQLNRWSGTPLQIRTD